MNQTASTQETTASDAVDELRKKLAADPELAEQVMQELVKMQISEAVLTVMQTAFEADPLAVHAACLIGTPCNQKLADHPHVVVMSSPVLPKAAGQVVGVLGFLNGILAYLGVENTIDLSFENKTEHGVFLKGFALFPREEGDAREPQAPCFTPYCPGFVNDGEAAEPPQHFQTREEFLAIPQIKRFLSRPGVQIVIDHNLEHSGLVRAITSGKGDYGRVVGHIDDVRSIEAWSHEPLP
jgi:hypothetical protein